MLPRLLLVIALVYPCLGYHPWRIEQPELENTEEDDPMFWKREAQESIEERVRRRREPRGVARNVVMFLGDGMSLNTLTAARTLLGQREGNTGEESRLSFEKFPSVGLAKTYCRDAQIADSACTATAYLCGAKANTGTIGVDPTVKRANCSAATAGDHQLSSIAAWALEAGKSAGIVTTTRVTHASPAGAYAHTSERDWESDADVAESCGDGAPAQHDIAYQLVHSYPGNAFKVIMGGGRREMLSNSEVDEEGTFGRRLDGRNLIEDWKEIHRARNVSHEFVWNRDQLMKLSEDPPEYLLGLFEGSHMHYNMEVDQENEPSLAEMTEIAIRSLKRNENGFFLFVEGGRIDHAHHENFVRMALDETIELSKAVTRALGLLSTEDSLLVVTSDHAHVMAFNGYSPRGNDILGPSDMQGDDGVPYMTLTYTNGPGFRPHEDGKRQDVTKLDYTAHDFRYPAKVPLESETHGGDDVAVFARGPHHDLFVGLYEQSQLPHLMGYAACIGPGKHACDEN